jgi:phosphoribosylformylglycinamidine synthase
MGDACRALDYPIVSGNVSLYNESKATGGGSAILPTPAIGGVGLLTDHDQMATIAFKQETDQIWVIGGKGTHLGQSLWLKDIAGREAGAPPKVDLKVEAENGALVRKLIADGTVNAVHDISDGGLLVAIAEMALAGNRGAILDPIESTADAFGEDQSRYVVTAPKGTIVPEALCIGSVGGWAIQEARDGGIDVDLVALREANEAFFKDWMEA